MTIIEQARRVLARIENQAPHGVPAAIITIAEASALCRALIVRTKALEEVVAALGPEVPFHLRCVGCRSEWINALDAARRALADEPHTGQGD